MRYLLLALAAALVLAAAAVIAGTWVTWTLRLHLKDKRLKLELCVLGLRRTVLDRNLAGAKPSPQSSETAPKAAEKPGKEGQNPEKGKEKKQKQNFLSARWEADKKRIYDPENGGFQMNGFTQVLGEYRTAWREIWEKLHGFFGDLRYKLEIPELRIRLDIGTGDPAHTGMVYGWIWNTAGILYPVLSRYLRMAWPYMEVTPDFYGKRLDLEIMGIIKVRPAHIINALIKQGWKLAVTYLFKNFKKGSVNYGREQASH